MYENINDYPFYITDKINELVDYINKEDTVEYSSFTDKYCSKDSINGSQEIVEHILFGKDSKNIQQYNNYNMKPNVYMFVGPMWDTGITTALKIYWKILIQLKEIIFFVLREKRLIN